MPMRARRWLAAAVVLCVLSHPAGADGIDALVAAYPDHLAGREGNELVWKDGTRMPISDGKTGKSFNELLDTADLDDMFVQTYTPGPPTGEPAVDHDPGRIRNAAFFVKMYGGCHAGEVKAHLTPVRWVDGSTVRVSDVNRLAVRLQHVSDALAKLPKKFRKYLVPSAGTYNCRNIAGTTRHSMHAFAAAIDISTAHTDYWLWNKPVDGRYPYRNRIPIEIVEIFERHGFIWGGKWYHYDTMHFEYRPELFLAGGTKPVGF
jgi:hypothetical protein